MNERGRHRDVDELAGGVRQGRPIAKRKIRKTKFGKMAAFDDRLRSQSGNRVIAMTACKLMKEMCRVLPGDRHFNGDQQFIGRQRRLEDSREEIRCGNPPLAAAAASDNRRIERKHAGRQFRRRIGMGKAAANRSSVADRRVRNMCDRLRQQRRMRGDLG